MRNTAAAAAILTVVVLGVVGGYLAGVSNSRVSTTTATVTSTATPISNDEIFLMKVNGSTYWADDISKDVVIGNPGYSYFLNGTIIFDGVRFETICPPGFAGCPQIAGARSQTQTIVAAGVIKFNMTFPGGLTETTGTVIGDSIYTYVISLHAPKAGMLIEYVNDYRYTNSKVPYAVFLLVSSCCSPPYVG